MKLRYLTALQVEKLGGDRWRLLQDLIADCDGEILTVPAGFVTDFASVPRLPLAYLLAGNTAHRSAVLHDWLYAKRVPRRRADLVFLAAMKAEGVALWRRELMFAAVRLAGGAAYARPDRAAGLAQPNEQSGP